MATKKAVTKTKKPVAKKARPAPKRSKYVYGLGRRKSARAKVKLYLSGSGLIKINKEEFKSYFPTVNMQTVALEPLVLLGLEKKVDLEIATSGGGKGAQAASASLGIARALVVSDAQIKTTLKKAGLLTRDARKKERKKPGLKRARRAPQWSKR